MPERNLTQQAKTRLRRIEGQVRGLQRMLGEMEGCGDERGEPCDSLLTQVLAVRAAVEQVGLVVLELHLERCVLDGDALDDEQMTGLRETLKLWSRLSAAAR